MAFTKDELSALNDVVYGAITKFYQKVIAPQMATKDDLESMATKDDLKNMATKDDIRDLSGKIDGVEERLTNRIDKLGEIITETRTNHERRIRKLEDEAWVEPVARLTI